MVNLSASGDEFEEGPDRNIESGDIVPRKEFRPSVNRPLPSFQCVVIKKDGERCKRWAEMGFTQENAKCPVHGGDNKSTKERNSKIVEAARLSLVDSLDLAVQTLQSLLAEGTADGVRLKAATEIMDRAGLRTGIDIDIKEEIKITTTDDIKKNLEKLWQGQKDLENSHEDIMDAEVVEPEEIEGGDDES